MKLKIVMLLAALCVVVLFSSGMLARFMKDMYYAAPQSLKWAQQIYGDTETLPTEPFSLYSLYSGEAGQRQDDSYFKSSAALKLPLQEEAQQTYTQSDENDENIVYLSPSWAVRYEDEQALMKAADLVVIGTVAQEAGSKFSKGNYMSYTTEVTLEINKVYKGGKVSGDVITIAQMGGFDGEVLVIADHTTLLKEQQQTVLFLRHFSDGSSDGVYKAINEDDGIFVLENGIYKNISSGKQLNQQLLENIQ